MSAIVWIWCVVSGESAEKKGNFQNIVATANAYKSLIILIIITQDARLLIKSARISSWKSHSKRHERGKGARSLPLNCNDRKMDFHRCAVLGMACNQLQSDTTLYATRPPLYTQTTLHGCTPVCPARLAVV